MKRINKVNDHSLGRPKHLTKYMRMNHVLLFVFTFQLANKTIFHGEFFSPTWQTKITNSESKILRFPRYRHIFACIASSRYRLSHDTGTLFRCPKCVPVSSIYCTPEKWACNVIRPVTCVPVTRNYCNEFSREKTRPSVRSERRDGCSLPVCRKMFRDCVGARKSE